MASTAYNPTVAARTRVAQEMLSLADVLKAYLAVGGKQSDLETIRDRGLAAEALNLSQSQAKGAEATAVTKVYVSFAELQRTYSGVMAIVRAAMEDALEAGNGALAEALERILANEATITVQSPAAADGKRSSKRAQSQEALRAEIEKDAGALLKLTDAHALFTARKLTVAQLTSLKDNAKALSGRMSDRTTKLGAGKGATQSERDAVAAQSKRWSASYRLLAQVGRADTRLAALLKDAAK